MPVRSVRRMNDTRKLRAAKQMRRDVRRSRKRRHTKADDDILVTTVRKTLAKHPAVAMAALMPTTWPLRSTSGPPLLPGLIAASVWIAG